MFEIALPFKGNAFRVVYAVQFAAEIWVVHAFQKKPTQGIKTPKREIDLIKERLKRLKRDVVIEVKVKVRRAEAGAHETVT